MLKRIGLIMMALVIWAGAGLTPIVSASTDGNSDQGINEKLGVPIVVYGDTLTDAQEEEVRNLLEVENRENVDEFYVDGQDIANYINGNPNSRMFSSVKIIPQEKGEGLEVNIVTPDNITAVTKEMYANALLTAGVEDAIVDVASPVKVTGHSALTGIYKAYDSKGVKLDEDRMEVASEELDVATELAEKSGMDKEKVSELLTEIKKEMAAQNPATKEEIEQIINEKLKSLNIELSEEDRQLLINLFEKMRALNINFDQVQKQLEDITSSVKDLLGDKGFWQKVSTFLQRIVQALSDFFTSIFG
ncbi:Uncharacterized protein YpuA, DUF1002 family [Thalassobacillus cyri]|uniref:Uncharacterized protein YpuA, DUF1002 family n=1 Tax=Thalassobacillus cyri TaxID=571932 RepID=A0A1H4EKL9_9BACI|nr:DUF1002 domain-containing protein [Thalassobacillus cyri]SEA85228.1 Uncharacterized protein YpuA, DUF1002 family [Thalassobacillus cyri]